MIQNLRRNVELEIISQEILFMISFLKLKKKNESFVSYVNVILFSIFSFLENILTQFSFRSIYADVVVSITIHALFICNMYL